MSRLLIALLLLLGLAGCSRTPRTPTTVSSSPTQAAMPGIVTASIPTPVSENASHGHGEDEQDFEFDVDDATRAVEQVTPALEVGDWGTLFRFIFSSHASHMTAEDFASVMDAQEKQLGEIVKVEILSVPELVSDASGHVMFTIEIAVTYQKGEKVQVNRYLDYYVLEEGEWLVESSEPSSN